MSFSDFIAAADRGAAGVYHQVLQTGTAIADWTAEHPAIGSLIQDGVELANDMLARGGMTPLSPVAGADIVTALKALAASDATVPSIAAVVLGGVAALTGGTSHPASASPAA